MNLVNEFKMFDGIKTNEDGLNIKFHERKHRMSASATFRLLLRMGKNIVNDFAG